MKLLITIVAGALALSSQSASAQSDDPYEREPINYSASRPADAIARVQAALAEGKLKWNGDARTVVRQLLKELDIPVSSQILVFSKTSFQNDLISPAHPRSLFFSDTCYVGWVPGGVAEIASLDPELGPIFYRFDPRLPEGAGGREWFVRDRDCFRCHGGQFVRDIPGVLARSVAVDSSGMPQLQFGSTLVDYTTPIEERWGGWYATGRHGAARHRGNVIPSGAAGFSETDLESGANVTNLSSRVNLSQYAAETSDIVALAVFEHEIAFHNAVTKASFHCRQMMAYQRGLQHDLKEAVADEPVYDSCKRAFANSAQDLLDALLFKDEAPLPAGGIEGVSSFEADFQRKGIRDAKGRSLRDLQLLSRVFKYRCSHLIYTPGFEKLQPVLRRIVLERLWRVLTQPVAETRYGYLGAGERSAIREILKKTLPNLPVCWQSAAPTAAKGAS